MSARTTADIGPEAAEALGALANLFDYPTLDVPDPWEAAEQSVGALGNEGVKERMHLHRERFSGMVFEAREELFVSTFDLGAACAPYVSVHLFGEENFKRAAFLAALRGRMEVLGFNWGSELPDHVGALLRFVGALERTEAEELTRYCLLGALVKMKATLPPGHAYRELLETVEQVLNWSFPGVEAAPLPVQRGMEFDCALAGIACGVKGVEDA